MFLRTSIVVVAMMFSGTAGGPPKAAAGTADGSMTVSGKASHIGHVRAFPKKVFGRPAVLLVFSDTPLSAADAANDSKLSEMGNAGTLHGMGIVIGDDGNGKWQAISNEIYDQGMHGRMSIGGEDTLEAKKNGDVSTAGRLFLKPLKKFDSGTTFTYDVTFDAPLER
jgi:hypothetical protein